MNNTQARNALTGAVNQAAMANRQLNNGQRAMANAAQGVNATTNTTAAVTNMANAGKNLLGASNKVNKLVNNAPKLVNTNAFRNAAKGFQVAAVNAYAGRPVNAANHASRALAQLKTGIKSNI